MKPVQTLGLLTIGLALTATSSWSQSTPTGTATSTSQPQGAVAPDQSPADDNRNTRQSGRRNRANRRASQNSGRTGSNTNTSPQDARYRQGSSANGTVVNSSNTTNYDVNSSVTAPTGAGSNPNSTGTPTTPPNNDGANNSMSGTNSMGSSGSATGGAANGKTEVSGTAAAVTGARMTKEPAIKAGSTERNTSIHDYIASSPNHVTLQNALQSANLYEMMKENGPYTLFAPSNAAFKKLPAVVQAGLLEGQNRDALKQLLSYHIISGAVDAAELTRRVKAGNGKAMLQTLAGTTLTAQAGSNGGLTLTDEQGKSISVDETDLYQANGIVHTLNGVLMPKAGTSAFK